MTYTESPVCKSILGDFIPISKNDITFALSFRGALFVKQTQKRAEIIPIEEVVRQKGKGNKPSTLNPEPSKST